MNRISFNFTTTIPKWQRWCYPSDFDVTFNKISTLFWFLYNFLRIITQYPVNMYLLQVNNRDARRKCEICSKLNIKTPERRQCRRSSVFIVNFEHILHIALLFLIVQECIKLTCARWVFWLKMIVITVYSEVIEVTRYIFKLLAVLAHVLTVNISKCIINFAEQRISKNSITNPLIQMIWKTKIVLELCRKVLKYQSMK